MVLKSPSFALDGCEWSCGTNLLYLAGITPAVPLPCCPSTPRPRATTSPAAAGAFPPGSRWPSRAWWPSGWPASPGA